MDAEKVAERTWHDFIAQISSALNYQLFELDGHGVSIAKLLTGLVLLFLGYAVSRRAANEVDRRLLGRLNLEESLRYTFRRLIFYLFFFVATMFTLRTLNVPITIFTVVGGALAVGIGFGSQNLVNNFISGILVMVERPVRVNDFIEVDGVTGTVTSIGIRSTSVRTLSNAIIIIPNTSLIEKYLINWSLSAHVAGAVRIGVAYGTDAEVLKKICLEAVKDVPGVLTSPEPSLSFVDFGDNALLFDIGYNVPSYQVSGRGRIASDIRFNLNKLLNFHKISVPFPQRDVHLDVRDPLTVKILN